MLIERIQGRAVGGAREVVLVPELVVRASSGGASGAEVGC